MIKTLLVVAALALTVASAHSDTMPRFLEGQWCQHENGLFVRAKNFCKPTRPTVFTITKVGFWISHARVRTAQICSPVNVETYQHGWFVAADCGASDNTTPVSRLQFVFEDGEMWGESKGSLMIKAE
jgi:hypothetical protein